MLGSVLDLIEAWLGIQAPRPPKVDAVACRSDHAHLTSHTALEASSTVAPVPAVRRSLETGEGIYVEELLPYASDEVEEGAPVPRQSSGGE